MIVCTVNVQHVAAKSPESMFGAVARKIDIRKDFNLRVQTLSVAPVRPTAAHTRHPFQQCGQKGGTAGGEP